MFRGGIKIFLSFQKCYDSLLVERKKLYREFYGNLNSALPGNVAGAVQYSAAKALSFRDKFHKCGNFFRRFVGDSPNLLNLVRHVDTKLVTVFPTISYFLVFFLPGNLCLLKSKIWYRSNI